MNRYLIPANTKRGQLIVGIFRKLDLYIFGGGVGTTFIMLLVFQNTLDNTLIAILCVLPALIATLLCLPIPNYHNVRVAILEIYDYFTTENRLRWRGWCYQDGSEKK